MDVPFRVIAADPAWSFGDPLPGKKRGAAAHYRTMPLSEICGYLDEHPEIRLADDALLFLWRVAAMQEEALAVAKAWGFRVKSELVWVKTKPSGARHMGMGRYTRLEHEVCLIASRGQGSALIRDHSIGSTFTAPVGVHSAKPEEFFRLVERLASGPFLELFARGPRPGWTTMGLEARGVNAKIPLGKEIDEALAAARGSFEQDAAISRILGRHGLLVTVAEIRTWDSTELEEVMGWLEGRCKRRRPTWLDRYAGRSAAE